MGGRLLYEICIVLLVVLLVVVGGGDLFRWCFGRWLDRFWEFGVDEEGGD